MCFYFIKILERSARFAQQPPSIIASLKCITYLKNLNAKDYKHYKLLIFQIKYNLLIVVVIIW